MSTDYGPTVEGPLATELMDEDGDVITLWEWRIAWGRDGGEWGNSAWVDCDNPDTLHDYITFALHQQYLEWKAARL